MKLTKLEKVPYTTRTHTTGGREGGTSRSIDGRRQVTLSTPGTSETGTNPEQLFAAGWPAFTIDAEIDLGLVHGSYNLAARLNVNLPGMGEETARSLVETASHTCPYSLPTSGNIEVHYNVITVNAGDHALEAQHA